MSMTLNGRVCDGAQAKSKAMNIENKSAVSSKQHKVFAIRTSLGPTTQLVSLLCSFMSRNWMKSWRTEVCTIT